MSRTILLLCLLFSLLCLSYGLEIESPANPKLVAKTVYEYKFKKNDEGVLEKIKVPHKKLFQVVNRKTQVPDPTDPSNTITIDVPTEIPYNPNNKAKKKINKLKSRLDALQKREHRLKAAFRRAASKKRDWSVLEDGAPAPPDPQEVAMAQELYGEIEATQIPKAGTIKQSDIDAAREYVVGAGAKREAHWKFFDEIKEKMLVPSHAWSSTM